MKKIRLNFLLLTALILTGIYSCSKSDDFEGQGGLLPTHYINIMDSSFSPSVITIANGNSVTFLNKTTGTHTIISENSSTIASPPITGGSFYYVKPDTLAGSAPIYINYHCIEHPTVTGTIILTP